MSPSRLPRWLACVVMIPVGVAGALAEQATNPLIWADVPDCAVIRVGDQYYMSSTTMHMAPGLPLMRSTDLVDWDLVGYAYKTLADNDALNLSGGRNAYGAGSWASSLRHRNDRLWASTFSSTTGRTHVFSTPASGPLFPPEVWASSAFRPSLHDHSLFFDDDGRVWMVYGGGDLRLIELTEDASSILPGGFHGVILKDASRVAGENVGLPAEGSQLLKHDGHYYLMNITWPRGGMRTQIVHRSKSLTGPWEGRVALSDAGVAQGTLVDTPRGDWYALLFQDHGAVGRTPYLVPVRWESGWPVLGQAGKAPKELDLPADPDGIATIVDADEFDRRPADPPLPLAWQWNHNPVGDSWSIAERPGWLRLKTGPTVEGFLAARNTLTQRTFGPRCAAVTRIDTAGMQEGDVAGLGLLQKRYGYVGVTVEGGVRKVIMVSAESESPQRLAETPLDGRDIAGVHLRIECDFEDRADVAYLYYSPDGESWTKLGEPLKMAYTLPHFMGYRFALFNYATKQRGGRVDFDYFRPTSETLFTRE